MGLHEHHIVQVLRTGLASAALALVCLTALELHTTTPALAVSYPPGWNLVSGPTGSTLSGATGNLYTLGPGDTDYEVLPATAPLVGCRGYWAYFPSGGAITFRPGSTSCSVGLHAGEWTMLGNPSATAAVTLSGAETILTYKPGAGYQSASTLQPGDGAWVLGSGIVVAAVTAQPQVQPQPAVRFGTTAALKQVALGAEDLPGFTLDSEDAPDVPGMVATYEALWRRADSGLHPLAVIEVMVTAPSSDAAHEVMLTLPSRIAQGLGANSAGEQLGRQPVGNEGQGVYVLSLKDSAFYDLYVVSFRRGAVVMVVGTIDTIGNGSLILPFLYATLVDLRLQ